MTRVILLRWPPQRPEPGVLYLALRAHEVRRNGQRVTLSPDMFTLFLLFAVNGQHLTTWAEAIDAVWGEQEDGGPDYAYEIVKKYVHHIRRGVKALGVTLENNFGQGYRFAMED